MISFSCRISACRTEQGTNLESLPGCSTISTPGCQRSCASSSMCTWCLSGCFLEVELSYLRIRHVPELALLEGPLDQIARHSFIGQTAETALSQYLLMRTLAMTLSGHCVQDLPSGSFESHPVRFLLASLSNLAVRAGLAVGGVQEPHKRPA